MGIQAFDPGPDAKSQRVADQPLCLQVVSNLQGAFTALNHESNRFALAGGHRLKDIGDGCPREVDSSKNQEAEQKYRNDSDAPARSSFFHTSIALLSRYSCKITVAARASISCCPRLRLVCLRCLPLLALWRLPCSACERSASRRSASTVEKCSSQNVS